MHYNTTLYTLDTYALKTSCPNLSLSLNESTSTEASEQDILLFTGSIIDKSEIHYRELMNKEALYFTIIPDDFDEENVDSFWHMHTIVLKESFANEVLSSDKIESFLNILETVENFTSIDIEKHLKDNELQDDDFENYTPVNITDYQPQDDFLGGLASGFRGASKEEVVYKLNYNSHDKKGTKAVIARFSIKEDEPACNLLNVQNITDEQELTEFYLAHKTMIENFIFSDKTDETILFKGKGIILTNISDKRYLIIYYKDKKSYTLFKDEDLYNIDEIERFDMYLNKYDKNKEYGASKFQEYKRFIWHIIKYKTSKDFEQVFAKIINSSHNKFLKKYLQNNTYTSQEILTKFYDYIFHEQLKIVNNQLLNFLNMLFNINDKYINDDEKTVNISNEKAVNIHYFIRDSFLRNNKEFLKTFNEYIQPNQVDKHILEEIEECVGDIDCFSYEIMDNINSDIFQKSRGYNIEYLDCLKSEMMVKGCTKHLDKITDILSKLTHYDIGLDNVNLDEIAKKEYDEKKSAQEKQEEVLTHLTYIHKFLTTPTQLNTNLRDKLNINFIFKLLTMWSIQSIANKETTPSMAKSFIQKNYLTNTTPKHKKIQWRFSVCNELNRLYTKYTEFDHCLNSIKSFDSEQFDNDLIKEFNLLKNNDNSFVSTKKPPLSNFISIRSATTIFNKNFYKSEDNYWIIIGLSQLFGKKGNIVYLLQENPNYITTSQEFSNIKILLCNKDSIDKNKSADKLCLEFLDTLRIPSS